MLPLAVQRVARACRRRTFASKATSKEPTSLSDIYAKAAIGDDPEVRSNFVSVFAPLVHDRKVRVDQVSALPPVTNAFIGRDMEHDLALRYRVLAEGELDEAAGEKPGKERQENVALMEIVPFGRALVEIQRKSETYLAARTLAHVSSHFLSAVQDESRIIKEEDAKANEKATPEETAKMTTSGAAGVRTRGKKSDGPRKKFTSVLYTAYVRVEPVHLIMLCDFCHAYDHADSKKWRSSESKPMLAVDQPKRSGGIQYSWASPLFTTFRLTSDAPNLRLIEGATDPGRTGFADNLFNRLSITMVHLPLVPDAKELDNLELWLRHATLPAHKEALQSLELRQWLVHMAQSTLQHDKVLLPQPLSDVPIFIKSAASVERKLSSSSATLSDKEFHEIIFEFEAARAEADKRLEKAEKRLEKLAEAEKRLEKLAEFEEQVKILKDENERLKAGRPDVGV